MLSRCIAIIILFILSPFLLMILIITTIDLKANPIFIQTRVIDGKSEFKFYKIRSMNVNAPNLPTDSLINAHLYISKWGRFLRSTSIDEILNLISVINGDMNFIGPRPIMPNETNLIELRKRYGIKSKGGLTGFAQINGRDFISPSRKIAAEKYYELNKSNVLNFYIFLKTVKIVFLRRGISH
jgi:O-antigen biosynthesis protein WbqP